MTKLSLQWRITLMTALLIGITCVSINLLLCSSGVYYMNTIADAWKGNSTSDQSGGAVVSFDPQLVAPSEDLTIIVDGAQTQFRTTNWYITAAITLLSGILAHFVSGRALRPLRRFAQQAAQVETSNLSDIRLDEKTLPELRSLACAINEMLERLSCGFDAQRQFVGNAAHELRTPLTLLQTQLELFSDEHPDILPESAEFLASLQEQIQRLSRLTHALLDMSDLQSVPRDDIILLSPMVDEIFDDLAPLAERNEISLSREGEDLTIIGSDMLLCRMFFNLQSTRRQGKSICTAPELSGSHLCAGHWTRHSTGVLAEHLSTVLPRGQIPQPRTWRSRTRPSAGMGDRTAPCRPRLGRKKFGGRQRADSNTSGDRAGCSSRYGVRQQPFCKQSILLFYS